MSKLGLSTKTKLAVDKAVVLPSLLYRWETWKCYWRHIKKLDQFHLRCRRKILCISWKDHILNQEILHRAKVTGIEAMINLAQRRWSGYVSRIEEYRLPKQLFYAELSIGQCHVGGTKKAV